MLTTLKTYTLLGATRILFDEDFGGYNVFSESWFEGTSITQVVLSITQLLLNFFLGLGLLFFAWKFASVVIDYFNMNTYSFRYREQKHTMLMEMLEPVKGLLILTVLATILNLTFNKFLTSFDNEIEGGFNLEQIREPQ